MKGIDTNVLVRYLVRDDKKQAQRASEFIQRATSGGKRCFINHIVLCELVWVLESAYNCSKREIVHVLEKIVMTRQFEIERKDIARLALYDFANGKGDFADYFIGRINQEHGCDKTATFDRSLKDSDSFEIL